jgi:hypothetical protein
MAAVKSSGWRSRKLSGKGAGAICRMPHEPARECPDRDDGGRRVRPVAHCPTLRPPARDVDLHRRGRLDDAPPYVP